MFRWMPLSQLSWLPTLVFLPRKRLVLLVTEQPPRTQSPIPFWNHDARGREEKKGYRCSQPWFSVTSALYILLDLKCPFSLSLSLARTRTVVPALVDRLGDGKDQVRDQAQTLILKLMEEAATPMVSYSSCALTIFTTNRHLKEKKLLMYSSVCAFTSLSVTS